MATIEVPDALIENWPTYDEGFALLERTHLACDGLSRDQVRTIFGAVAGNKPWQNPSFTLWACVKYGATNWGDFTQIISDWRNDQFAGKPRPHLHRTVEPIAEAVEQFTATALPTAEAVAEGKALASEVFDETVEHKSRECFDTMDVGVDIGHKSDRAGTVKR